jgi:hypothetical protein
MQEARVGLDRALEEGSTDPQALSAALYAAGEAAEGVIVEHDTRPTARAWRAHAATLKAVARLVDWREAVRRAEADGRRYLDSAHLVAQDALGAIDPADPALARLAAVLSAVTAVTRPADVDGVVAVLRHVPLPMPIAKPPRAPTQPPRHLETDREPVSTEPLAVALFELGGEPAPDTALVQANHFTDLKLQLRLTEWPEWADEARVTAVSVAGDNASFPSFRFTRPGARDEEGFWTVEGTGKLVVRAAQPLGDDPLTFSVLTELAASADGTTSPVRTVAQRELRLWASDDTSLFTTSPQLDRRVAEIFALVANNDSFGSERERKAFMRLLRGLLRATTVMQARRFYRDTSPNERQFQTDLLMLLDAQDALHGQVQEGTEIGGGETDLVHNGVVAELKVEKTTAVTDQNAPRFLGQTTSYASGLGSQLGIAVILDLTEKTSPVGHPANYVRFFEPKLHGVADPAYPSHVAVLVVNGNVPLPSDFAAKRVAATQIAADAADAKTPDAEAPAGG